MGACRVSETSRHLNSSTIRANDELTGDEIKQLVAHLSDIVGVLRVAVPQQKADICRELGVSLRYDPGGLVTVHAQPRGATVGVGGGTQPITPRAADLGEFELAA